MKAEEAAAHLEKAMRDLDASPVIKLNLPESPQPSLPESPLLALDEDGARPWQEERDDTLAYLEHQLRRLEQLGNRDGRETALAFCRRMLARIEAGEHEGARARATEPAGQEGSGENE